MNAWVEDNLRAFTKHLRVWIRWEYEDKVKKVIFNPLITLITRRMEPIEDKIRVLVKGKQYDINLKEWRLFKHNCTFGRVPERWSSDMGLGLVGDQFRDGGVLDDEIDDIAEEVVGEV
ncbi:hypothetical protein POM88_036319 [Heracleum sosnowskyi]|uniref:Uncharacterized protein n=1 Tax=Heracleum sosnowskyi TaxID=360622 RepID=A0AAD8HPZ2_9APIA|nr:hypothetical protein POM88_036319 [Heracleum sosnowskyi]